MNMSLFLKVLLKFLINKKVVLIGDSGVGKTTLLSKYLSDPNIKSIKPTIGLDLSTHVLVLDNGTTVKAHIWDTAGQEKYRSMASTYFFLIYIFIKSHYRNAVGAFAVYDITKQASFESVKKWIKELRADADPNILITLLGNKLDLVQKDPSLRQVSTEEAEKYAQSQKLLFHEVSGVDGTDVDIAFKTLMNGIFMT